MLTFFVQLSLKCCLGFGVMYQSVLVVGGRLQVKLMTPLVMGQPLHQFLLGKSLNWVF